MEGTWFGYVEGSFRRELVELARAGRNQGKGYVGMVLLKFCRRQRRASGFPGGCWQASTGSGGQQGRAGLDWELCANWPGSRERGSETQSVGDCHTWVKCAEACELEVRWGQEHSMLAVPACHTRPC